MIIHRLIARHLKHRDDGEFYQMQAQDAVAWLEKHGVRWVPTTRVLDLGCGLGVFGHEAARRGCEVVFADEHEVTPPGIPDSQWRRFSIGREALESLGQFDVVLFSNVLEHLPRPNEFLSGIHSLLRERGFFYLSWTNWLSPWGGHEFSPFHYLGARRGHLLFDRIAKRKRLHTPFVNLFPTYVGEVLRYLRSLPQVEVVAVAPRYYSEFTWITRVPLMREFLTWNCGVLLQRKARPGAAVNRERQAGNSA